MAEPTIHVNSKLFISIGFLVSVLGFHEFNSILDYNSFHRDFLFAQLLIFTLYVVCSFFLGLLKAHIPSIFN